MCIHIYKLQNEYILNCIYIYIFIFENDNVNMCKYIKMKTT